MDDPVVMEMLNATQQLLYQRLHFTCISPAVTTSITVTVNIVVWPAGIAVVTVRSRFDPWPCVFRQQSWASCLHCNQAVNLVPVERR